MKKLFIIFTLLLFATGAWAADSKLSALTALEAAPAGTDQLYINDGGVSKLITIDYLFDYIEANILTLTGNWVNTANPWADNEVSDTLTATTIVVADNESTDEENALIFSSGGDVDGGSYQLESDGNATYNPSTGTITATQFSGGGAGLTAVDAATGDSATDFFDAGEIADARIANDITASNYVPLSGFTQDSGILVGTGAGTYAEETGATLRTSIGAQATLTNEAGLYSALSDVSDFVQTSEIDSAAELESVANLGAYFSDLADDADAATMRTTLGIDTAANLETNLSLGAFASDLLGYASAAAVLSGISAAPLDSPTFTTDVTVGAGVPVVMGSYYWEYESAAGPEKLANSLMLYDGSDDALFGIDGTNGTIYFKSSLTPSVNLFDSSSDTAETNLVDIRADQYAGGMGADFTTVTATEEVSDVFIYYQDAGTKREAIWIDGSADTTYFGYAGQDGKIGIYSEQGETDYQVTFAPHATMTQTTAYVLPANDGDANQVLETDGSGNLTWANDDSAGSTALDDVADPDAASSITCADGETLTFLTSSDNETWMSIANDDAELSDTTTMLDINFSDVAYDGSALAIYLNMQDYAANVYTFSGAQFSTYRPVVSYEANAAGGGYNAFTTSQILEAMDGADDFIRGYYVAWTSADHTNGFMHAFDAEDITGDANSTEIAYRVGTGWDYALWAESGDAVLDSDGSAIKLGADQDVTLTHVADTGIQIELDDSIMFGDTAVFIESDDDGYLDLDADTGIRLNAATAVTGLITPSGGVAAQTPMTDAAADFAANFTGAYLYGGTFVCDTAGTIQLPVMAEGMNFTIITSGDIAVVIDTNAADGYLMDGTTNAEGKNLTNQSTTGDIAVIQYYTADDWLITTNGWDPEE